jgi:hypothetical protein
VGIGTSSPVGRITSTLSTGFAVTNTLTLNNAGGGGGSGTALNFYASQSAQPFTGRLNSLDDGAYGYHLVLSNKVTGADGNALTERMRIDSSGNLLVGQTAQITTEKFGTTGSNIVCALTGTNTGNVTTLRIQRYQSDGDGVTFFYGTAQKGYIAIASTGTTYNSLSDYRLKENIAPMVGALDRVMHLNPVSYVWKDNQKTDEGFIAHEVKKIIPSAVTGEKDELDDEGNPKYQGLDQSRIVSVLTAAIQEQQTLIEALTARLTALEAK